MFLRRVVSTCCLLAFAMLTPSAEAQTKGVGVRQARLFQPVSETASEGNAGVFVGVNEFTQDASLDSLSFAVHDAIETAYALTFDLKLIPPKNCFLLLSGTPSSESVRDHLEELQRAGATVTTAERTRILVAFLKAVDMGQEASDIFVCSLSSHGFTDPGENGAYVMPSDGVRQLLTDTAVPLDTIEVQMEQSKAGHRLLLVDACQERVAAKSFGAAGAPTADAFIRALQRPSGQAKLASCSRGEFSYEHASLGGCGLGLFTHAFLTAIRGGAVPDEQGVIRLGPVASFVESEVSAWTKAHHREPQNPLKKLPVRAEQFPLAVRSRPQDIIADEIEAFEGTLDLTFVEHVLLAAALDTADPANVQDQRLLRATREFLDGRLSPFYFTPAVKAELLRRFPATTTPDELRQRIALRKEEFFAHYEVTEEDYGTNVVLEKPITAAIDDRVFAGIVDQEPATDENTQKMFAEIERVYELITDDANHRAAVTSFKAEVLDDLVFPAFVAGFCTKEPVLEFAKRHTPEVLNDSPWKDLLSKDEPEESGSASDRPLWVSLLNTAQLLDYAEALDIELSLRDRYEAAAAAVAAGRSLRQPFDIPEFDEEFFDFTSLSESWVDAGTRGSIALPYRFARRLERAAARAPDGFRPVWASLVSDGTDEESIDAVNFDETRSAFEESLASTRRQLQQQSHWLPGRPVVPLLDSLRRINGLDGTLGQRPSGPFIVASYVYWCPYCHTELDMLHELAKEYEFGLVVIDLSDPSQIAANVAINKSGLKEADEVNEFMQTANIVPFDKLDPAELEGYAPDIGFEFAGRSEIIGGAQQVVWGKDLFPFPLLPQSFFVNANGIIDASISGLPRGELKVKYEAWIKANCPKR